MKRRRFLGAVVAVPTIPLAGVTALEAAPFSVPASLVTHTIESSEKSAVEALLHWRTVSTPDRKFSSAHEEFHKKMAEAGWHRRQCNAQYVYSRSHGMICSTPCNLQYGHPGPHKDWCGKWNKDVLA